MPVVLHIEAKAEEIQQAMGLMYGLGFAAGAVAGSALVYRLTRA
jgi:hypothetical protein